MDYIMNKNKIIISQMKPIQGHECLSACLGNIFNLFYPNVSSDKIIIAGNGIDVRYDMSTKIVDTPMYKANFVFLDQYNINYTHNCINNQNQAKDFLDNVLERKQFIVLKLDASFLSYSRVFNQTSNASHFLNILGKENSMYQFCDGYIPTRKAGVYKGNLDEDILFAAWENKNYEYLNLIELPDELIEFDIDVENKLYQSLIQYCQGGKINNQCIGKDAIWNAFLDCRDDFSKERAYELNYQLRIYGFLSTKEMIYSVINENHKLTKYSEQYKRIIMEWDSLIMSYLKIAFAQKKNKLDEFFEKLDSCIEKEIQLLSDIIIVNS